MADVKQVKRIDDRIAAAKNHGEQLMRKRETPRRGCAKVLQCGTLDTIKMATYNVRGCQSGEV
jgi:hypothetical protein